MSKTFHRFQSIRSFAKIVIVSCDEQVNLVIKEANKLKIPVIGFVDASLPSVGVDFVVPVRLATKVASLFIYDWSSSLVPLRVWPSAEERLVC
ncbi:MAG: 30S ribosomal protein S2 [Candidatus Hodgkinia cicadicola]